MIYVNRNFPQEVHFKESIKPIKSIHGGVSHTICITHDDKIYTWGDNEDGQLGLGDKKNRSEPSKINNYQI